MDNLNPIFRPFEITGNKLSSGNYNLPIKVEVWDWENDGKHRIVGFTHIYISDIFEKN
jgi:hypothetical protein